MSNKFTEKAENALNGAVRFAENYGHTYIGSEHILLALAEDRTSCASMLMQKNAITKEKIDAQIRQISGVGMKTKLSSKDTTPRFRRILECSYKISRKFLSERIGSEHILLAIIEERDSVAVKILFKLAVDIIAVRESVVSFLKTSANVSIYGKEEKNAPIPTLLKYGRNMTAKAELGEYDPVIGREREIDRLIRILSRKNKNNPCLIGEAGVGKTAIVEGLADKIVKGEVPAQLIGKIIISVDLVSMVAGAKYRGDFEERIKNMLDEAKRNKSVILFIDEVHTIVGAGSAEGAIDAANIMKPELSRGELRLIGATTIHEYRKYIEKDSALERRFQPLMIEEPTKEEALSILRGLKSNYEKHHGLIIEDDAISYAVSLSIRYIQDRFLPDKALDLLDEACAGASNKHRCKRQNISNFEEKSEQFDRSFDELTQKSDAENSIFSLSGISVKSREDAAEQRPDTPVILKKDDVIEVVSELYGVHDFDTENLSKELLVAKLGERIVGQNEAISSLASAVVRSSVGIGNKRRPRGIFLFLGESGVGKTELAKALSEVLFKNESSLIRYDMSEYGEPYSVSKLVGSAPGYVGYDDTNSALEKIRRHPYSVVLLDEIEKAHPDVLSLLLQIFDTGILTDASGRKINFKNAYIVMTSNIGADKFKGNTPTGFIPIEEKIGIHTKLKGYFPDEFINRIDDIVLFSPLDDKSLCDIAKIELEKVSESLYEAGIKVTFDQNTHEFLAASGKEKGFGARPMLRIISSKIENRLADMIATGELQPGTVANIGFADGDLFVSSIRDNEGELLKLGEALI